MIFIALWSLVFSINSQLLRLSCDQIDSEIERLESELEDASKEETIEDISNKLGEMYDLKDTLMLDALMQRTDLNTCSMG